MVRLKAFAFNTPSTSRTVFQFHNGAIKSVEPQMSAPIVDTFQFHNGAIKRNCKVKCKPDAL